MDKILSLTVFEAVTLGIALTFGVLNIIQYRNYRRVEKERLIPVYNGLIGLLNAINNKISYWFHERGKFLKEGDIPYESVPALRRNFYEFVSDSVNHLSSLREHLVSVLKTIEPDENKVFKARDYLLTPEQRLQNLRNRLALEKERKRLEAEEKRPKTIGQEEV